MTVGLTGGSGAGKSSACDFFEKKGFRIVDLDAVSREVCKKGSPCLKEIAENFGKDILDSCGELKRRSLGDIVFNDEKKLKLLNSITHKYIIDETKKIIAENGDIVLDAPLLFESGLDLYCDIKMCILSKRENRIQRIMQRDGITELQAEARISSQPSDEFYLERCDVVIHNDSDISVLNTELEAKFGGYNGK